MPRKTNDVPPSKEIEPLPLLEFKAPTLAPSRIKDLAKCPGYIGAVLDQDTEAADEGTMLHAVLEKVLAPTGEPPYAEYEALTPEHREMIDWADGFYRAEMQPKSFVITQEVEFDIPFCANKARIDVLAITDRGAHNKYDEWVASTHATILDWKFGRKKQDPADRNPQLRAYAVGIWNKYPHLERMTLILAYPRMKMHDRAEFTRADYITTLEDMAKLSVKCDDYLNRLSPGEACKFCGRKLQCPAIAGLLSTVGFPVHIGRTDLYDPKQLASLRKAAGVLQAFLDEVKQWTSDAALKHGIDLPGFVLVEKSGTRSLVDGQKALGLLPALQKAAGLPEEIDWTRLVEGLGITVAKLETYLKDTLRNAHNGKPPKGSIGEIEKALSMQLSRAGLIKEGKPTVYLQEGS